MTRHQWRQRMIAIGARLMALRAAVDVNDRFFFVGLAIAARGGWLVSPRWTMVAGGVVLMAVGLTGIGGANGHSR